MKSKTLKTTLMRCVIVGLLLTSRMLTGCASASRADVVSRQLYQAPVLRLQAGPARGDAGRDLHPAER